MRSRLVWECRVKLNYLRTRIGRLYTGCQDTQESQEMKKLKCAIQESSTLFNTEQALWVPKSIVSINRKLYQGAIIKEKITKELLQENKYKLVQGTIMVVEWVS